MTLVSGYIQRFLNAFPHRNDQRCDPCRFWIQRITDHQGIHFYVDCAECGARRELPRDGTDWDVEWSKDTRARIPILARASKSDGVVCFKCGGYVPSHATGAADICTCDPITTP